MLAWRQTGFSPAGMVSLQKKTHMYFHTISRERAQLIFSSITKTCLYTIHPIKPHFYTVKLWFIGVYTIFLISVQNIDCGYSLEPPRRGGSNEYPQSMF